ncbi:hypothetical protein T12_12332 [Trichinella patagoniensis]|uniref:Uncharacterized protein n=1 Tax=Trichinella patagoniensis TaxID=990121 RepID=A0A0V0ZAS8_9BILA|nr:hypothetical protein T12_12332 [Trichinella patagoniensis]
MVHSRLHLNDMNSSLPSMPLWRVSWCQYFNKQSGCPWRQSLSTNNNFFNKQSGCPWRQSLSTNNNL